MMGNAVHLLLGLGCVNHILQYIILYKGRFIFSVYEIQ